jgi:hypothetical protein
MLRKGHNDKRTEQRARAKARAEAMQKEHDPGAKETAIKKHSRQPIDVLHADDDGSEPSTQPIERKLTVKRWYTDTMDTPIHALHADDGGSEPSTQPIERKLTIKSRYTSASSAPMAAEHRMSSNKPSASSAPMEPEEAMEPEETMQPGETIEDVKRRISEKLPNATAEEYHKAMEWATAKLRPPGMPHFGPPYKRPLSAA